MTLTIERPSKDAAVRAFMDELDAAERRDRCSYSFHLRIEKVAHGTRIKARLIPMEDDQ